MLGGIHTFLSSFENTLIYIGDVKNLIGKVVSYEITYSWSNFCIGLKIKKMIQDILVKIVIGEF